MMVWLRPKSNVDRRSNMIMIVVSLVVLVKFLDDVHM